MEQIEVFKGAFITADLALHIPEERTLVVADLHIGYESALEAEGIHIPHIQTRTVIDSLSRLNSQVYGRHRRVFIIRDSEYHTPS